MPITGSTCRTYKKHTIGCIRDEPWISLSEQRGQRTEDCVSCRQAKQDFHATKREFQLWKLPEQFLSKHRILQNQKTTHTHTHSISRRVQTFLNCLVSSIIFVQAIQIPKPKAIFHKCKFQTWHSLQKNKKQKLSKHKLTKCGRFGSLWSFWKWRRCLLEFELSSNNNTIPKHAATCVTIPHSKTSKNPSKSKTSKQIQNPKNHTT